MIYDAGSAPGSESSTHRPPESNLIVKTIMGLSVTIAEGGKKYVLLLHLFTLDQ